MINEQATKIGTAIFDSLEDRKGFRHVMDQVDEETQNEILADFIRISDEIIKADNIRISQDRPDYNQTVFKKS